MRSGTGTRSAPSFALRSEICRFLRLVGAGSAKVTHVPGKETWERRRHVRVRPAADYDIGVELCEGAVFSRVSVVDVSLGGLGLLVEPPVDQYKTGASMDLRVSPPEVAPFRVTAVVRHAGVSVCGIEFQNLEAPALAAMRRAVAELLERGQLA
jgi:hypothetical protein